MQMNVEYDTEKPMINFEKHGIDFEQAQKLWEATHVIFPARSEFENRFAIIGKVNNRVFTCIFTLRGENTRIISCRISRKGERSLYENAINASK